ncbi:MAG TPA: COX15/CtaA family protein [Verrucomicrobiae bacterium]
MVRNSSLQRYAVFSALATFVLVWMGGLVTSHEAGLTVPDWPNSYGYNMFFFPVSKWIGGIFYEHTHRLVASGVGFLTSVLALWLYGKSSRPLLRWIGITFMVAGVALCPIFSTHVAENLSLAGIGLVGFAASFLWPNCEPSPKWLRILGVIAFFAVVTQGVLGGLRVTLLKDQIGIFHATLAQVYLLLMCAIALFLSDFWQNLPVRAQADLHRFRTLLIFATALILCQLMLGATMRHQHAGLSIPDFPAAYGKIWPATDAASLQRYNSNRVEVIGYAPITAFQIELQMAHRLMALAIFVTIGICAFRARREFGSRHWLSRLTLAWFGLILTQAFLGAATIWTNKSADIATAHVACGALCLVTGGLTSIIACRLLGAPIEEIQRAGKNELATLLPSSSISAR